MSLRVARRAITRVALLASAGGCTPRASHPPAPAAASTPSRIDTLGMRAHTFYLAHDRLAGRGTGTPGADLAALYLEAQCRARGLLPAGTARFTQSVPLDEAVPRQDATSLVVGEARYVAQRDFVLTAGVPQALRGFRGPAVLLGTADDIRRGVSDLPPLAGAVAVVDGAVRADVANLLDRRGAVGIIQRVDDPGMFALYAASRGRRLTVFRDSLTPSSFYPEIPAVLAGPSLAPSLASPGATIELSAAFDRRPIDARNVACMFPGRDPSRRDTAIVFTAHYDHLGISIPDASGDSIYNGFSDNAAGVAMLLAIADALRDRPDGGLRYSTMFLFFTAEERGLFGSDYYVAHPTFPLERVRAVINLDAGAPPGRPWSWRVAGGTHNPLGDLARDVAAARGWSTTVSPATPNSDYFPFARQGVPAIFVIPGPAPYEGLTADSSQALRRRWDRYHQPGDAYFDDFPFSGLQRYAEFALAIAEAVDARPF